MELGVVVVCFLFLGGRGASQLPGCEGGRGASQLWSCVVFFCGEWRRVSFRGGEGGAGGQSALELGVVVVCFLFLGGRGASQLPGFEGGRGASQLWKLLLLLSAFFFGGGGGGGESASSVWLAQRLTRVRKCALSGRDSVRKGFCQAEILSGRNFVREEFCQEGILSGRDFVRKGFCQEGILSGRDFARKEFCQEGFCQAGILSGRNFVRQGFCQEAGSARKRALPGSGLCQEAGSARKESQLWSCVCCLLSFFWGVRRGKGGESALELGVVVYFLFLGGRGASQLPGVCVVFCGEWRRVSFRVV